MLTIWGFLFSPQNILTCGLKEIAVLSALDGKDNDCNEPLVLGQNLLWGQKILHLFSGFFCPEAAEQRLEMVLGK